MRALAFFIIGFIAASASGANITLSDGRVFSGASILNQSAETVTIRHQGGLTSVRKELLPDDLRTKYAVTEAPKPTARATANAQHRIDFVTPDALAMGPTGKDMTVKGQCFIATKGGTNYKLGNVLVSIYPESTYVAYIKALDDQGDAILKEWMRLAQVARQTQDYDSAFKFLRRISRAHHDKFLALPPAPYSTRTDADGKFSITHNLSGPFRICAVAEREVGEDQPEYYEWHVRSTDIDDLNSCNLSNHNL